MAGGAIVIVRSKREPGYTVVFRTTFEDERLSFEARGLLAYLLVKPDNWKISVPNLQRAGAAGKRKGQAELGRDRIYAMLEELIQAGYVTREQRRAAGKMVPVDYVVYDRSPLPGNPYAENADTENPHTENPDALISTKPVTSTKNDIAASTDDAARAADPTPPETLVKAGSANPNGAADQPSRGQAGKPEVVEVTAAAAVPDKVSQADIRGMVEAMAAARGYPPANFARHTRAAKRLIKLGHTPGDVTRTVVYIRRECAHLNGQPLTMETVSKYIGIAAPIRPAPTPGEPRELPDWMAA